MEAASSRRTVLVVEDSIAVQSVLEDFFTLYGYDVVVASHPDTALRRLKASAAVLDAMILDMRLDDNRSGLEVLELLRLDDRFVNLTVVVLTGLDLSPRDLETIKRNRAHVLYKQQGFEKVFESLNQIIRFPPLRSVADLTQALNNHNSL